MITYICTSLHSCKWLAGCEHSPNTARCIHGANYHMDLLLAKAGSGPDSPDILANLSNRIAYSQLIGNNTVGASEDFFQDTQPGATISRIAWLMSPVGDGMSGYMITWGPFSNGTTPPPTMRGGGTLPDICCRFDLVLQSGEYINNMTVSTINSLDGPATYLSFPGAPDMVPNSWHLLGLQGYMDDRYPNAPYSNSKPIASIGGIWGYQVYAPVGS